MKTTKLLITLVICLGISSWPVSAQSKLTIKGFLYSKLKAIQSRSEAPQYFLQLPDSKMELAIELHAKPYRDDPTLHRFLGTKVEIVGEMKGNIFSYISIQKCDGTDLWCHQQH
jgi:hypothetical protein